MSSRDRELRLFNVCMVCLRSLIQTNDLA